MRNVGRIRSGILVPMSLDSFLAKKAISNLFVISRDVSLLDYEIWENPKALIDSSLPLSKLFFLNLEIITDDAKTFLPACSGPSHD